MDLGLRQIEVRFAPAPVPVRHQARVAALIQAPLPAPDCGPALAHLRRRVSRAAAPLHQPVKLRQELFATQPLRQLALAPPQ